VTFCLVADAESSHTSTLLATWRLDDFRAAHGVFTIDFLKLEAKGFEIEVFEGLGEIRPRKVGIDVSPERGGSSPASYFKDVLKRIGSLVRQRGNVLFGLRL
jgi:hypothetical protein